jgi:hypothetical protein
MWQRAIWQRIAVIASAAWLGAVLIYTAADATIVALLGIIVIFIICLGIPWIASVAEKPPPNAGFPKLPYQLTLTTPQGKRLIPFDDVLRFSRHSRRGDSTIATFHLTTGEAVTGEALEDVLQLLSKSLAESPPKLSAGHFDGSK